LYFRQKNYPRALYYSRKCLREWSEVGIQLRIVRGLADIGIFLVHAGSLPGKERLLILAATLFGAAKKVTGDDPIPIFPEEMDDFDQELELLRSQLTDAEFDKGWDEGQAMPLEQAVAYALGDDE
jgi:hypothetical protein